MRQTTIAGCLLALFNTTAGAQPPAPATSRWSVAVHVGSFRGGPGDDLVAGLRSAGYTDNFGGCDMFGCWPQSPSPEQYSHANPAMLGVRRQLGKDFAIEVLFGQGASGQASGRRGSTILNLDYGASVYGLLGAIEQPGWRLLAGPALVRGGWTWRNTSDGSSDHSSTTAAGVIAGAGIKIPIGSWFLIEGSGQYRVFGKSRVREPRLTVPAVASFDAGMSHSYLGIGAGLRF